MTASSLPRVTGPLTIAVLPAVHAYDYEAVRRRLLEPELLCGSVAVRVFRAPLLAVSVGGSRLGGFLDADSLAIALAVCEALGVIQDSPECVSARSPRPSLVTGWWSGAPTRPIGCGVALSGRVSTDATR